MRHPAEYYIKFLMIRDPALTDAQVLMNLNDWGFLQPMEPQYLGLLRGRIGSPPANFSPLDRTHRASSLYLREQGVYDMFFPTPGVQEAMEYLGDPDKRRVAEQVLLARLDLVQAAKKVNAKYDWHFSKEGLEAYRHFYWNISLLTFDEWGRYMYQRTAMYEQYMALLLAPPKLAFYHLRLDQTIESKNMIKRTQEIAYFTLEEIAQKPGTGIDKVKAIGLLGKIVIEAHNALSTSDMALKDVLKQFERFRMEHPGLPVPSVSDLAPEGNYSKSGLTLVKDNPPN
jgi:hypothetical protein